MVVSRVVRWDTSLPSGFASTAQVMGVVAVVAAVIGMVLGFGALARALTRDGDAFGAGIVWTVAAGIVLLPALFLGGYLLLPAFVALIVRGHVGGAHVRLPAAALLVGLMSWAAGLGWPEGAEGTIYHYAVSFLGASVEGVGLIWFGRATAPAR